MASKARSADETLQVMNNAIFEIDAELGRIQSTPDSIHGEQLTFARDQLKAMARELLDGRLPPRAQRARGLAQMAADHWDPRSQLTSLVIRAERQFEDV